MGSQGKKGDLKECHTDMTDKAESIRLLSFACDWVALRHQVLEIVQALYLLCSYLKVQASSLHAMQNSYMISQ